jgi:glutamine cyclotransferase
MSKSKRIGLFVVLGLLLAAYLIIPLIDNMGPKTEEVIQEEELAQFSFADNLSIIYGKKRALSFHVTSKDVSSIELVITDKVIQTWNSPKGKISFQFDSNQFPIGAQEIKINIYKKNILVAEDSRLLRVLSNISPKNLHAKVVSLTPHITTHFTQGLEFNNQKLYESTGQYGESSVNILNLQTGEVVQKTDVEATCFGEGITIMGQKLYEVTWKEQKCFVYDKSTLKLEKTITYAGEGWGLCNNGKQLIMSDGSERIYFRDPNTFELVRTIEVYDQQGPIVNLNELEYINGKIYANIWQENYIIVIDPILGRVEQVIHCEDVVGQARGTGEVLNGIAYNPITKKLYLTGKNWSKIAEVEIE